MSRDVDIRDAQHRWYDILSELGVPASALRNKHGPCPLCGGTDRFRWDDKEGRGTWICSACGAGDGADLAMKFLGVDFKGLMERMAPLIGTAKVRRHTERIMTDVERRKLLNDLWSSGTPIAGDDPVDRYLRSRGLGPASPWPKDLRTVLRETGAIMLARVCDRNGRPITLHRTFLSLDGKKAAREESRKLMPGKVPEGIAVHLMPCTNKVLGIAEGIETAIAASILFQVPVWAAIAAHFLETWHPPDEVELIYVFGDNDANFTGQAAAYKLARRLVLTNKKEVKVEIPERTNDDWNDVLAANQVSRDAISAMAA